MSTTNNSTATRRRIYIAGKVTGEDYTTCMLKFGAKETELTLKGFEVLNPLKVVNDASCSWEIAMRKCLAAMLTCDAVYLLPCWPQSRGAILERYLAGHLGIEIIDAEKQPSFKKQKQ